MKAVPRPIPAPVSPPPRRVPERPLPSYRYVPGLNPHPFRHPQGHLYRDGSAPEPLPAEERSFLYGLDLWEHRFYWEAHEVWEDLWHQTMDPGERERLQGLIQAAAATLKRHLGHQAAAERLCEIACARLARSPEHPEVDGVRLRERLRGFVVEGGGWPSP